VLFIVHTCNPLECISVPDILRFASLIYEIETDRQKRGILTGRKRERERERHDE